jgi:ribosome recycling factor
MAINEVANVSAPDAQLLVVKPWDKSLIAEIEKAIQVAQLNLSPVVDGELIRIPVPPLTQERRQEMVKTLNQKVEEIKVMLRGIRSDVRRDIENQKGEAGISEDDIKLELEELEEVVKDYISKADTISENKEKDLLSI